MTLTLLINNAGWNSNEGLFSANALDNARREIETNYLGTLSVSRAFQPILAQERRWRTGQPHHGRRTQQPAR